LVSSYDYNSAKLGGMSAFGGIRIGAIYIRDDIK
jgi:hypothetical protein